MDPRAVLNLHFRYSKSPGVSEQRDEAVQLPIDPDFAHNFDSIRFEPAIVVMEIQPAGKPDHPIKNPARNHFVPGIEAAPFPTIDKIESGFELANQAGHFGRIVLQVCIKRDNELAAHTQMLRSAPLPCQNSGESECPARGITPGKLCDLVPAPSFEPSSTMIISASRPALEALVNLPMQRREVLLSFSNGLRY
jgi:hypothetical protein